MKCFYDHGVSEAPKLKKRDHIYLKRERHLKGQPISRLAPRCDSPYQVLEKIGMLNYRLKLTSKNRHHLVFHVDQLRSAKAATMVPNRDFPEPPPIIINEKAEYKVEKIQNSRVQEKKFEYYVKWKGYPNSKRSWKIVDNVANAKRQVNAFHRKHLRAPRSIATCLFLAINFQSINKNFKPVSCETLKIVAD